MNDQLDYDPVMQGRGADTALNVTITFPQLSPPIPVSELTNNYFLIITDDPNRFRFIKSKQRLNLWHAVHQLVNNGELSW